MKKLTLGFYFYNDFDKFFPNILRNLRKIKNIEQIDVLLLNNGGSNFPIEKIGRELSFVSWFVVNLKSNIKPGGAKRKIIEMAKTEYVGLLDSDDKFEINMERMPEFSDYEIIGCNMQNPHNPLFTFEVILNTKWANEQKVLFDGHDGFEEFPFCNKIDENKPKSNFAFYEKIDDEKRRMSGTRKVSMADSLYRVYKNKKTFKKSTMDIGFMKREIFYSAEEFIMLSNADIKEIRKKMQSGELHVRGFFKYLVGYTGLFYIIRLFSKKRKDT